MQIKEYSFNGSPYDSKFHISSCGNFIYFFLQIKDKPDGEASIKRVVILSLDTLREWKIMDFDSSFKGKVTLIPYLTLLNRDYYRGFIFDQEWKYPLRRGIQIQGRA